MVIKVIFLNRSVERRQGYAHLPPPLRPFPGPKLSELAQFRETHVQRFLWGTYRPGVYFGLRPRLPNSLVFGLMWTDPLQGDALTAIRHEAQEKDGESLLFLYNNFGNRF